MNFEIWLETLIGDDTRREASKRAGMAESTLSRQLSRGSLRPEMVIALCRGYNRSPVTGLIETGYLQKWETEDVGIPYALEQATNQQILDEILRRSDPEARELFGGDENTIGLAPEFRVVENTPNIDSDDGTVMEWDDSMPYAADSSPDEDKLREERGEDIID